MKFVFDANIFPKLIEILAKGENKTRKEAAWAVVNATSSGTPEQIRYLIELNVIPPLCDLLSIVDTKVVEVALNGLDNILKLGQHDSRLSGTTNPYAIRIEECGGLDKIEFLQGHQNEKIYKKTFQIIETYFSQEEDDTGLMPQVSFYLLRLFNLHKLNGLCVCGTGGHKESTIRVQSAAEYEP